MDFTKIGNGQFTRPEMARVDWHSYMFYKELADDLEAVYVLRDRNEEVLYVGHTTQLKKRLTKHLYSPFENEIESIDYLVKDKMNLRELEKILYFFLKPKYSNKKIIPHTLYQMKRRQEGNP